MKTQQRELAVQLIDSSFTKDEGCEVIMALLDNKIKFHQNKRFSEEERLGKDLSRSGVRIEELRQEKKRVQAFFEQLDGEQNVSVSGLVHMVESSVLAMTKTA
ncbi:MAG: hypothetical protein HQ500_06865 [Flavobacteriales bacterium]|nr:hypothetical protein [Flavobacteriales bacterium]